MKPPLSLSLVSFKSFLPILTRFRADAQASYESEWKALKGVLNAGNAASVYGITVGSESLYRGVSAFELLPRIKNATAEFGKFTKRIGTVDSWNKFQDGTADPIITGGVKFL